MKTTKEITREVLIRSGTVRKNNELKRIRALSGSSAAVFACLTMVIVSFAGYGKEEIPGTQYGAFLLSAETGGYILVAVLAFVFGVIMTILAMKYKKLKNGS